MIVTKVLSILFLNVLSVQADSKKEDAKTLLSSESLGENNLVSVFSTFSENGNYLDVKKMKSLKGVFEFVNMDKEYREFLNKVLHTNHAHGFNFIGKDNKAEPVKKEFYDATTDVLNEIFNKNDNICNLDEFVVCQNEYFTSFNKTKENDGCGYLSHISKCSTKACPKSAFAIEAIGNFTQVCTPSKKQKQTSFLKKNAKDFIKSFDKNNLMKSLKQQTETLSLESVPESSNGLVESELYYKKNKLKGVSSECIIPHFKPKFELKSCNKKQFFICREIMMAELVLTKVHLCPNCENENAYDTCICKCCVAKELLNMCYKPNCNDDVELARYYRYIEDTCRIKPVVVIDDAKKRDEIPEVDSEDVLLKSDIDEVTEHHNSSGDSIEVEFVEILDEADNLDNPINMSKLKIQAKKGSLKGLETNKAKRSEPQIKSWEVQYLENNLEDEIVEDEYVENLNDDMIIYSQEDLEQLEAYGCNPYEVSGECYHDHCCYPPKPTTKYVYQVTTETDLVYSTVLRYKIDTQTKTETQVFEDTVTIQVPKTTVTTTKYKKKIVPKFKKTVTVTTTSVSVVMLTVTVTTTAAATNAVKAASEVNVILTRLENFQQAPNRRPTIPNLIRILGTTDNETLENNTTRPYNGRLEMGNDIKNVTLYSQSTTFDNSEFTKKDLNISNTSNSTIPKTFSSLGKMNNTNKTGIVVSFITIVLAFLVTVKNSFESDGIINESDVVVSDILQNVSHIEKRVVSTESLNANYENETEDFSFVKDELSRLSMNTQSELTDNEVLEHFIREEF